MRKRDRLLSALMNEPVDLYDVLVSNLSDESWLYGNEISILKSFLKQANAGKVLSMKQNAVIIHIDMHIKDRKEARLVAGGACSPR